MNNFKLHFLNHTSFLIEHNEWLLLLDPWPSLSTSFDGWVSNPPCFMNEELLAAFINSYAMDNKKNFAILVSHGHDDHCDDNFLKKISPDVNFFIPKYNSPGVKRRIGALGFENIHEIPSSSNSSSQFGPFKLTASLTNFTADYADDNAIVGIFTDDYSFIHANDCSIPFPKPLLDELKSNMDRTKIKYFASQTNRANCWPHQYPQIKDSLSKYEFDNLVTNSIRKTIQSAINNAHHLNSEFFISYGGYTAALPLLNQNPSLTQFFPSPENIKSLQLDYHDVTLSEAIPGDTIDTMSSVVQKPFWNRLSSLEKTSKKFLEGKKKRPEKVLPDKYYDENMMPDDVLITSLEEYMEKFNNFLLKSFDNVLPEDVNEKIFRITIEDIGESVSLVLGKGCVKQGEKNERIPTKEMIIDLAGARALVIGRMNFESFYVGFNGSFKRNPIDVHNKVLIGHLQKFAYIYQKRLVPDSLKKLI